MWRKKEDRRNVEERVVHFYPQKSYCIVSKMLRIFDLSIYWNVILIKYIRIKFINEYMNERVYESEWLSDSQRMNQQRDVVIDVWTLSLFTYFPISTFLNLFYVCKKWFSHLTEKWKYSQKCLITSSSSWSQKKDRENRQRLGQWSQRAYWWSRPKNFEFLSPVIFLKKLWA